MQRHERVWNLMQNLGREMQTSGRRSHGARFTSNVVASPCLIDPDVPVMARESAYGLALVVVLIVWLCYGTLSSTTTSAEEKKWAMSVLSAATGGILGYLVRK